MEPPNDENGPSATTALAQAADKIRAGYLSQHQRDALAALLQVARTVHRVPSPIMAATFNAITALTTPEAR
jgi:hypothetical protein